MTSPTQKTEREEALEATNDRLAPVSWADGGKAIMGPDGTYWPFPLNGQAQQRWAAWCQKARLSLLSSSKAEGEMREALERIALGEPNGRWARHEAIETLAALSPKEVGK